jgi:hypothetical protein
MRSAVRTASLLLIPLVLTGLAAGAIPKRSAY